ncbi:MAG: hypothetical protein F6J89_13925 [Symploca sp. SIO1C4]|uniref:Uncharacterized protein n=1 Tax=Symploca sp. SIO1C4 TaxID=2607765 RepID=A0A6B3NAZ0_9CYAN|nr:hypothetical protein [Symploca sp. SIO1C4]
MMRIIGEQQTTKTTMVDTSGLSKYWTMLIIDPASQGKGYRYQSLSKAQSFFQNLITQFNTSRGILEYSEADIQNCLLLQFRGKDDKVSRLAGLCLRCYVSHFILEACKKLASQFAASGRFTYRDLLPLALDDDGKKLIILHGEAQIQHTFNEKGEIRRGSYDVFGVEILRTYNLNSESKLSLRNWTHLQTKQHPQIKKFLSQFGLKVLSDWALFNKVGKQQFEQLSKRDRDLVESFHAVYRRDRRLQPRNGTRRAPDPTEVQLREMLCFLQKKGVNINSINKLMIELKRVAKLLQDYDIWSRRGSPLAEALENLNPETGDYFESPKLIDNSQLGGLERIEQNELYGFLHWGMIEVLDQAIEQGLQKHIASVKKRPRYAPLAKKVISGFRLLYCQGMSLGKIAEALGMGNQSKASRVLEPRQLLSKIRSLSVEKFYRLLLDKFQGFIEQEELATNRDALNNLNQEIEFFLDDKIFEEAAAEISTSKNRSMNSLYAQRICCYLEKLEKTND